MPFIKLKIIFILAFFLLVSAQLGFSKNGKLMKKMGPRAISSVHNTIDHVNTHEILSICHQ